MNAWLADESFVNEIPYGGDREVALLTDFEALYDGLGYDFIAELVLGEALVQAAQEERALLARGLGFRLVTHLACPDRAGSVNPHGPE
jgi:hypothetical protein